MCVFAKFFFLISLNKRNMDLEVDDVYSLIHNIRDPSTPIILCTISGAGVQRFVDFLGLTQDTVPAVILNMLSNTRSVPQTSCPLRSSSVPEGRGDGII